MGQGSLLSPGCLLRAPGNQRLRKSLGFGIPASKHPAGAVHHTSFFSFNILASASSCGNFVGCLFQGIQCPGAAEFSSWEWLIMTGKRKNLVSTWPNYDNVSALGFLFYYCISEYFIFLEDAPPWCFLWNTTGSLRQENFYLLLSSYLVFWFTVSWKEWR